MKSREMNQELIRKRFVDVFEKYSKGKKVEAEMKEIVKEYEDIVFLLDDTLNCSVGIMDAVSKKEIKDKKEEKQVVDEILKELKEKSYLGF
jgi:ABC-type uncharacterized transport system substrate-binding protein